MPEEDEVGGAEPRILFTAPWEPVVMRRGDPLGLRAFTDQLADSIAPDLSSRVRDGRWVTILTWCLVRSQEVFHATGMRSVHTRAEQMERYSWLRPLELMWVARTIALADDWRKRPLSGQRRVRPWYEDDDRSTPRFGMTADQFRAYRQTGMYGGYRLTFRKWPGMTVAGDGWTPGSAAVRIADWLEDKLGSARPSWPLHHEGDHDGGPLTRVPKLGKGGKHDWWLRRWPEFCDGGRRADENTLPRPKEEFRPLPEGELLKSVIFADDHAGKRRLAVARGVAKAEGADHAAICDHLGQVFGNVRAFEVLPRFSRLADAGMSAIDLVAKALRGKSQVSLSEVAASGGAAGVCEELEAAAHDWQAVAETQNPPCRDSTSICHCDCWRPSLGVPAWALGTSREPWGGTSMVRVQGWQSGAKDGDQRHVATLPLPFVVPVPSGCAMRRSSRHAGRPRRC